MACVGALAVVVLGMPWEALSMLMSLFGSKELILSITAMGVVAPWVKSRGGEFVRVTSAYEHVSRYFISASLIILSRSCFNNENK